MHDTCNDGDDGNDGGGMMDKQWVCFVCETENTKW